MNCDMTDCSKTKLLEKGLVEEMGGGYVCSGDSHLSPIPQAQGLSLGPDTQSGRVDSWLQHGDLTLCIVLKPTPNKPHCEGISNMFKPLFLYEVF